MIENLEYKDRDYIYTEDKIYFSICGNLHSREFVFGMPYYLPTKDLENIMDIQINEFKIIEGEKYTKLLTQIDRDNYPNFIKDNYPDYYYSPSMWEILMKVNKTKIRSIIDPKTKVNQLLNNINSSSSEENPILYTLQQMKRQNPKLLKNIGVGGSSLLCNDFTSVNNDLDLIFYKRPTVLSAKEFSIAMRDSNVRFTGLEGDNLEKYVNQKAKQLGGSKDSIYHLVKNRWDILYIDGVKLDFSFVDESFQIPLLSYERKYELEQIKIRTKITNISDSYFMPTMLDIDNDDAKKVMITKRGYICLFNKDQTVEITGTKYYIEEGKMNIILIDEFNGGNITLA